jgi:hypothetical protein
VKRTDLLLLCMHIRMDVLDDDKVYCQRCCKMMEVVGEMLDWCVKCRNCPYSRKYGWNKTKCMADAARHMVRKHHTVITYMSGNWEGTEELHVPATVPLFE